MNAKEKLNEFKEKLDVELDKFLTLKVEEAKKIDPEAEILMEHVKELTLRGGKRIRAALLYYSYIAHGGKNLKQAMRAAMGMEMSETFLLTHDDILDQDDLRRGGITIHASYREICKKKFSKKSIDPAHFGRSMAIMAGDAAYALTNELIVTSDFKPKYQSRAIVELSQIIVREVYGEILDVLIEVKDNPTRDDVFLVQQLKTAPYTFDSPIKLGAILAGANEKRIKELEGYTVPLGTAYQIQDDMLGMFGSEDKTGKPVISDLREGKITLLILDALSHASMDQKRVIQEALGRKNVTVQDLKEVQKVIVETGAFDKSKVTAKELAKEGHRSLSKIKLKNPGKEFLLGIAEYIINRDY